MEKVLRTPKDHVVDGRTVEIKSATPREETSGGGVKFKRSNDGGSLVTAGQSKIFLKVNNYVMTAYTSGFVIPGACAGRSVSV